MEHIVRKRLAQLQRALSERNIELVVDVAAIQWLAEQGYDPRMGARPLMRLIDSQLTDRICGMLLSGELRSNVGVHVHRATQQLHVSLIERSNG